MVDRIAERIWQGEIIWTDDTTVPVLDRAQTKTKTGRFWVYLGDHNHRYAVFDYTPNRQRAGPETWLAGCQGYLQADAYMGDNQLVAGDAVTEVACWAHARRKFHEAQDSAHTAASDALSRIGQLYRREKRIGEGDPQARYEQRQKYAKPALLKFRVWLDEQLPQHLPKSPLGVATRDTFSNWQALSTNPSRRID